MSIMGLFNFVTWLLAILQFTLLHDQRLFRGPGRSKNSLPPPERVKKEGKGGRRR